jgi:hypothetical protein
MLKLQNMLPDPVRNDAETAQHVASPQGMMLKLYSMLHTLTSGIDVEIAQHAASPCKG